jgi:hypothetical protein
MDTHDCRQTAAASAPTIEARCAVQYGGRRCAWFGPPLSCCAENCVHGFIVEAQRILNSQNADLLDARLVRVVILPGPGEIAAESRRLGNDHYRPRLCENSFWDLF